MVALLQRAYFLKSSLFKCVHRNIVCANFAKIQVCTPPEYWKTGMRQDNPGEITYCRIMHKIHVTSGAYYGLALLPIKNKEAQSSGYLSPSV
jgi:hypothetical protein